MAPEAKRLAGIYLLTPDDGSRGLDNVLNVIQQSLDAGVRAIQYRDKTAAVAQRFDRASRLRGNDARRGCAIDR